MVARSGQICGRKLRGYTLMFRARTLRDSGSLRRILTAAACDQHSEGRDNPAGDAGARPRTRVVLGGIFGMQEVSP